MSTNRVRTSLGDQCVSTEAPLWCAYALPEMGSSSTYLHTDPYTNTASLLCFSPRCRFLLPLFCHVWKTSTMAHVEKHVPLLLLLFLYTVLYYISCPLSFRNCWLHYSLLVKLGQRSFYDSSNCLGAYKCWSSNGTISTSSDNEWYPNTKRFNFSDVNGRLACH